MEKLKIEKGIKIVPINFGGKMPDEHPFPFEQMVVGDSFLLKCDTTRNWDGYNAKYSYLYNKVYTYKKHKPMSVRPQFTIRKVSDGFRCWRTR